MSEANDIIKDFSEREFRSFGSTALFANLKWWANEENNQCNPETLDKALVILDDIILNEYKDAQFQLTTMGILKKAFIPQKQDYMDMIGKNLKNLLLNMQQQAEIVSRKKEHYIWLQMRLQLVLRFVRQFVHWYQ